MLYFIAIVAPAHIDGQVMVWKKHMLEHYSCKVALKSPAHITLVPPFKMSVEKEKELGEHLQTFSSKEKSFTIRIKDFDRFAPKVIFLHTEPDEPLLLLKQRLEEYLLQFKNFPFKKEERPFHPHITIANRDLRKSDFHKAWTYFEKQQFESSFAANSISLLKHNNTNWEIASNFPLQ